MELGRPRTRKGAGRSHLDFSRVAVGGQNESALDSTTAGPAGRTASEDVRPETIDSRRAASRRPASLDLELFYRVCRSPLGAGRRLSRYVANVSRLDRSMVRLLALLARPYEPSAAATRNAATFRASTSCRTEPSACPRSSAWAKPFLQASNVASTSRRNRSSRGDIS